MSRLVRKPTICIGENKDADRLRGNREADQRLCFRYTDTPYRFTVRQKKREVAVSSGVAHFSDKICAIVVSILRVFW